MPGLREMAQGFLDAEPLAAQNLRKVHDAGIPIALGTDAGSPLTLHGIAVQAELEALQDAGLSPADVVLAATRDAARAMGRDPVLGTIRKGRIADLLVLAEDPTRDVRAFRKLLWVIRGGEMRSIDELRPQPQTPSP